MSRQAHYYGLQSFAQAPKPCWTCDYPTTYRCVSCGIAMCMGCKHRHPGATYIGRIEDAPAYPLTNPTRFSRAQLALLIGYGLVCLLLIVAVVILSQKM